jgi:site-specific DNA-methyltransferase (adenine-specific)
VYSALGIQTERSRAAALEQRLYYRDARIGLYAGDCHALLPLLPAAGVDAVVTDPPYHLLAGSRRGSRRTRNPHPFRAASGSRGFMGQRWDGGAVAFEPDLWAEVLRVAKPGAHLLAFGSPRTYHRLASAIENAGWEIRDCLVRAYASGFPKSRDLDGAWRGWGSALKPAWEPILLARRRLVGTLTDNVAQHATGPLHIDACLIVVPERAGSTNAADAATAGRWPANLLLGDPIFDVGARAVVGGRQAASGLLRAGRRRPQSRPTRSATASSAGTQRHAIRTVTQAASRGSS